ncbi:hypothetical protein [Cohaesibacter celericrescens]|uniref:Helix-turn-helix domain-containing protein n=1 Tax=Cohaesibacter celericrescens TaxID=2067669 RepID=A0A2N5XQS1_9HYPH|nr:hypothetical protein [Cohaesibacter celericrescens]PLW76815.1 hypothetical protein C0081_12200 [Cohaesibacter celericrescens]
MSDILIHRSAPSSNYTVVRNEIFEAGLGMEALGLLTYLISRPANWIVSQMQLRKQFGIGRDKLLKILKELEGCGYIVRERQRNADTKSFEKTKFCVYDCPVAAEEASAVGEIEREERAPDEPRPEKPESGKPDTANPEPEKPESANPHLTSNNNKINNYIYKPQPHEQRNEPQTEPPSFDDLMAMRPPDRAAAMKAHGLTPASFGKTARQMGTNPRAVGTDRRSRAKNGTPAPPERQKVFVEQYSPQWEAWRKHSGKSYSAMDRKNPETGLFQSGWWFDSEWPPATPAQGQRSQGGQDRKRG